MEPTAVPEPEWVEDACLAVVLRALRANLEERDEKSVFRVLNAAIEYSGRLGELWEIGSALNLTEKLATAIGSDGWSTDMAGKDGARWRLGLAEYICLLPIRALIGLATHLDDATREKIAGRLRRAKWERRRTLYNAGFHRHALPIIEWLCPRLEFEQLVEGKRITPEWLLLQILVREYLEALQKCLRLLLDANERLFLRWYADAVAVGNHWAAAVILNRQGEYIQKLHSHFNRFVQREKDYLSAKVLPDLQGWPVEQASALSERLKASLMNTT